MLKIQTLATDARKGLVALAGLVGQAISLGLLDGESLHYAQLALAALTAVGVYAVKNEAAAEAPAA